MTTAAVTTPAPWRGADLVHAPASWIHTLTSEEVVELDAAIAAPRGSFPLPTLETTARRWADEVRDGRGFVVIRGLPVERWSTDDARAAFLGLGRHLGEPMKQNARGDLVADVRANRAADDESARRYETSEETPYHTDGSDMIGLLCLRQGRSGGQSSIVSSVAVVNEVHRLRPDLAPLLFEPWHFAMTADATDSFALPLVASLEPFSFFSIRWYLEHAQRQPAVPRLTADQRALLDVIDRVTADPEIQLDIEFRRGDIQLLSNRTVMHARTTFVDWDEPERRRHLLRLWLAHHDGAS